MCDTNELDIRQVGGVREDDSKRITSLRFLLIVFVVFIHNIDKNEAINDYHLIVNEPVVITWLKMFITDILGSAAVPLFFLFSSYLQFRKNYDYKTLLIKKIRSLLIPYILWILIAALLYFIVQSVPQLAIFFQNEKNIVRNWNGLDWINIFWRHIDIYPLAGQLWFLRNLIILVIVSHVLSFLAKKTPVLMFIAMTFFYYKGLPMEFGSSIFFYMLGWYFANYQISFFELSDLIKWFECIILLAAVIIIHICLPTATILWKSGVIVACVFFLKISSLIVANEKLFNITTYLAEYSFFLYAIHEPFLEMSLVKISIKIIPLTGFLTLVQFFLPCLLTICIGTGIGIILKKYLRPLFNILNGSRG